MKECQGNTDGLIEWLNDLLLSIQPEEIPSGTPRTPTSPKGPGSGIILVVLDHDTLHNLVDHLKAISIQTTSTKKESEAPLLLDIPYDHHLAQRSDETEDASMTILRVWWEHDDEVVGGVKAKGRLEAWHSPQMTSYM